MRLQTSTKTQCRTMEASVIALELQRYKDILMYQEVRLYLESQ